MPTDRSLDEFVGDAADDDADADEAPSPESDTESDTESGEVAAAGSDEEDAEPVVLDPSTVDPAEPTYSWSADGAACAACGEQATTRWRQDGDYVCADCKEW
ncbi:DUF7573 domain-containing protein [Halobaculum sp. P14]|uniref:DUF7573 domain-containing protein n=1 Tax=Halobaculum sp. P14 TaxID=3421638 RepID=UPI003EC0E63B